MADIGLLGGPTRDGSSTDRRRLDPTTVGWRQPRVKRPGTWLGEHAPASADGGEREEGADGSAVYDAPMNEPLFDLSIAALTARMRAGTLSPVTLVEAHIERARALHDTLNIFTETRFEAAREEARAAEVRYRRGQAGPLAGIPFSVKEMVSVAGLRQTAGIVARFDAVAERDATVVRRLRRAGGVVLGVTNVPEGGMWMETHNRIFGRTDNPWDPTRTPGGSSGGEGALVAAGGSVFGVGSDVGGSIRIPSAFCGVPGHKPTGGLVPNTGHWPNDGGAGAMLTTGPIARSADDLWTLLCLMAGPDGLDWSVERTPPTGTLGPLDVRGVRVITVPRNGPVRAHPAMLDALQRAERALGEAGARIERAPAGLLDGSLAIWAAAMEDLEAEPFDILLGDGQRLSLRRELPRLLLRRSPHTPMALGAVVLQRVAGRFFADRLQAALDARDALQTRLDALLGADGILLHPPFPRPAPRHRVAMLRPMDFIYSGLFNALHVPSTVMPVGFSKNGLPVSVQIIGARGRDRLTVSVGRALEERLGGWVRADPALT